MERSNAKRFAGLLLSLGALVAAAPTPPAELCPEGRLHFLLLKEKDPEGPALLRCIDTGATATALCLIEADAAFSVMARALWGALLASNLEVAKALLEAGGDPDTMCCSEGSPLLAQAAWKGDAAMVELLLDAGADPNLAPEGEFSGGTALYSAVQGGHVELAELLLRRSANPNVAEDYHGWTPLWEAVCRPPDAGLQYRMIDLLIAHGADPEARDALPFNGWRHSGRTPLACAVERGDPELARHLVARGADVNALVVGGQTILELALERGNEDVVGILRVSGSRTERELANAGEVYAVLVAAGITGASRYWMESTRLETDLDGDGVRELLIVLKEPGGSAPPRLLAVVARRAGRPELLYAKELGAVKQIGFEASRRGARLHVDDAKGDRQDLELRWEPSCGCVVTARPGAR